MKIRERLRIERKNDRQRKEEIRGEEKKGIRKKIREKTTKGL